MAAARSPKSKAKKPIKKSVTKQKKHRAAKQREYEKKRPKTYRPRIHLPPGSYMILPFMKKEPVVKKELDIVENQDVEKPVVIKKEPGEQQKQPVENTASDSEAPSVQTGCLCWFCFGYCY